MLLSSQAESFFKLADAAQQVHRQLKQPGVLQVPSHAFMLPNLGVLPALMLLNPGLLHALMLLSPDLLHALMLLKPGLLRAYLVARPWLVAWVSALCVVLIWCTKLLRIHVRQRGCCRDFGMPSHAVPV